jgi:ligand-binding sensor domain-containing protein
MWVATRFTGLSKFNGSTWTCFNTSNSNIPSDQVYSLEADPNGGVWVGFPLVGVSKFDGVNTWTTYDTGNSPMPNDDVYSLKYNTATNSIWIGTNGGVAVKTGTMWAVHTTTNSNFPGNYVRGITHNYASGNTWIAAGNGGIGKWTGTAWTKYTTSNSNLPSNSCWWVCNGPQNKIWAVTLGSGAVTIDDAPLGAGIDEKEINKVLLGIYPNPASNNAVIKVVSETAGNGLVVITDNFGKEVLKKSIEIEANGKENNLNIELESLPAGFYLCSLHYNNAIAANRKLVIQK